MSNSRLFRCISSLTVMLGFVLAATAISPAADPVEINVIVPMTGGAAFIGKGYAQALAAIELNVNKHGGIRGRPVKFVIADDAGNPQNSVQLFSALVAKKVPAVLGAALVAECAAMQPLIKDGPTLYCLTPAINPAPGSFTFSVEPSSDNQLLAIVHWLKLRGISRIGVITSTDASGQDADRAIGAAIAAPENSGAVDVAHEHFNPTDLSVAAQIERIKAANPQALFAWTTGTPFGTVLRAVNDAQLNVPVFTNNGNMTYAQMAAYKAFLPKELMFPAVANVVPDGITDKGVKAAVDTYFQSLKAVGATPEFIPSVAYDPAMLIIAALRALGPDATATQVRNYIDGIKDWPGTNGRYNFQAVPQRGLGLNTVFVAHWDPAKNTWTAVSRPGGELR
jgi:branched-chain amino acid transport system substrate-binding protein